MKKDYFWSRTRSRECSRERSIFQLKMKMEAKESLTIPTFSIKKKIKSLNLKKRYKIFKKNSDAPQRGKRN